jgi:tagaturonate reductase
MAQRTIPVLLRYTELYGTVPDYFATGFAAYLLFMKVVKGEGNTWWGTSNGSLYLVRDNQAAYFYGLWQEYGEMEKVVAAVLRNEALWGTDLSRLLRFEAAVTGKLKALQQGGALQTVQNLATKPAV